MRAVALAAVALVLVGATPAFAADHPRRTSDQSVAQPFRFPGTTPLNQQPFRFPGTTPLPGGPPLPTPSHVPPPGDHGRPGHRPTVIIVPPPVYYYSARPAGSWSYRWVPRYVEMPVWVTGHWTPDGRWSDGHYESRWTDYGAWEPYWVPSY